MSKSSKFYLKHKRKSVFYIYYFQTGDEKARLAVKRHDESSKWQIIVAVSKHQYKHREFSLKFEMESTHSNNMSVAEWISRKESAHLYVRSSKYSVLKPKFYIQMNAAVGSPAEYSISFLRKEDCDFGNRFLHFKCESIKRAGYLNRGVLASVGGGDDGRDDESITSSPFFAADSDPSSESHILRDLKEILTLDSEHFDKLVSEDYVFPDYDMFDEEDN